MGVCVISHMHITNCDLKQKMINEHTVLKSIWLKLYIKRMIVVSKIEAILYNNNQACGDGIQKDNILDF